MTEYYANVSFWKRYCTNDALAEAVAKCFPEYWLEYNKWYSEYHPSLQYTEEHAVQDAYHWAALHCDLRNLPWKSAGPHSFESVTSGELAEYAERITAAAADYLKKMSPKRPFEPLVKNPIPLADGTYFLRGSRLADQVTLEAIVNGTQYKKLQQTGCAHFLRWGPLMLEREEAEKSHFCIAGVTRAGKTIMMRLLYQCLHPMGERAIIYDYKNSLLPVLLPRGEDSDCIAILNPFDKRGVAWDIAADAATQHRAQEIAAVLFPDSPRSAEFFVESPRVLVAAAIDILNEQQGSNWTFWELIRSLCLDRIKDTFNRTEAGRQVVKHYLHAGERSGADVLKTIDAKIKPFLPVAAAWSKASESISLLDWVKKDFGCHLLLGYNAQHHEAITRINRAMFKIIATALSDGTYKNPKRTFLFLDELETLGHLEDLENLLRVGAEVGATVILGFHDLDTLKAKYGQATEGILAMCSHTAVLRVNSRNTARWAADNARDQEIYHLQQSETTQRFPPNTNAEHQDKAVSTATSQHVTTRHVITPSQFMELPLTSKQNGLSAYFMSHMHPPYRGHLKPECLFPPKTMDEKVNCPYEADVFEKYDPYHGLSSKIPSMSSASLNIYPLWNPREDIAAFEPRDEADLHADRLTQPTAFSDEDTLSADTPIDPDTLFEMRERLGVSDPPSDISDDSLDDEDFADEPDLEVEQPKRPSLFDMKRIDLSPPNEDE